MRKLLKTVGVIQTKEINDTFKRKKTLQRLNPFNPLTYIFILIALIVGIVMFGIVGIKNEINLDDLKFKWK